MKPRSQLRRNSARTMQERRAEAASARDLRRRRQLRRRSKLNKVACINEPVTIMNSCNGQ